VPFAQRYRPRVRTEIRSGVGLLFGWDLCANAPLEGVTRVEPVLAARVLESGVKPPPPPGPRGLDAFGREPKVALPGDEAVYTLIALGRRDASPEALRPLEGLVRAVTSPFVVRRFVRHPLRGDAQPEPWGVRPWR
jgi:hypothetical protein